MSSAHDRTGSTTPLPTKLGITDDCVFTVRHAPPGFAELLGDIGDAVWQQSLLAPLDLVIAFHTHRALLDAEWPRISEPVHPDGGVWVAVPKPTSGVTTDLSEDVVRARLLKLGWLDNKTCGIDETWTAVRFARRPERLRPKENAKRKR